jgi:hypothetical protein
MTNLQDVELEGVDEDYRFQQPAGQQLDNQAQPQQQPPQMQQQQEEPARAKVDAPALNVEAPQSSQILDPYADQEANNNNN